MHNAPSSFVHFFSEGVFSSEKSAAALFFAVDEDFLFPQDMQIIENIMHKQITTKRFIMTIIIFGLKKYQV